jgi:probable F420-dependent oxidoreductase
MKVGFLSMNTTAGPPVDELAQALVDRGFESLWFGEHSHIPFGSEQYYPGDPSILRTYASMLDPLLTGGVAASAAPTLHVGTAVALPLQRNFLVLAKELATLDVMTGGRFHFGIGVGWNRVELEDHTSISWSSRFAALEERVAAIRAVWSEPAAGFDGRFDSFSPCAVEPAPDSPKGVPIYAGLGGSSGLAHTARWADGWMPLDAGGDPAARFPAFHDALAAAGRSPAECPVSVVVMGDRSPTRIDAYRQLGVERVIIGGGLELGHDTLSYLDRWAGYLSSL